MSKQDTPSAAAPAADRPYDPRTKQKAEAKLSRIPVKVVPGEILKKPDWIRVKAASPGSRRMICTGSRSRYRRRICRGTRRCARPRPLPQDPSHRGANG